MLFPKRWLLSRARLPQATRCEDRKYRLLARRYVAPSRDVFDTSGNRSRESARCAIVAAPAPASVPPAPAPVPTPTPVPLLRRHPHQLRRHRLQRHNPRLRSPRALVANCNTRGMRRCPGGLVAKQEHRGSMLTTMDYCPRWTMRLWCPCWRNESQSMRPFGITAHRRAHQTCQPLMGQTFILRRAFLRRKRHHMRKYGGNL